MLLIIVSLGPESYFARNRLFGPVMELFLCGRYDNYGTKFAGIYERGDAALKDFYFPNQASQKTFSTCTFGLNAKSS